MTIKSKKLFFILITVASLGAAAAAWVLYSGSNVEPPVPQLPDGTEGVVIESPPTPMPNFSFYDHNGKPIGKRDFKGKWSLIFFGYTHCPDFCPNSMAVLDKVARTENLPATQFVFASVDPQRDTPEALKQFVGYFNPGFIGMSGQKAEVDKFTLPFGVIYDFEEKDSDGQYIVNHFGAIYVIDPKARLRAYILPPHKVDRVLNAYQVVRKHYDNR